MQDTELIEQDRAQINGNKEVENEKHDVDFEDEEVTPLHPIAQAVDKLLNRVSAISFSAKEFIPMAGKWQIQKLEDITNELKDLFEGDEVDEGNEDGSKGVLVTKKILDIISQMERHETSDLLDLLISSHFLSLFTSFDAFTGELLNAIYLKKPDLLKSLNRTMSISDMLKYEDLEDIKLIILQDEIESFRRKSYVEQFESLETRFSIKLKKFNNWPLFVECSQRRNLITHCDGVVSNQYIKICTNEGCKLPENLKNGDQLKISIKYLGRACNLISEVGLKLGQSLWRKFFEDELDQADQHLHLTQYDYLKRKQWASAINSGEFSSSLPKYSSEVQRIIMLVNYLIALKFSENDHEEKITQLLDSVDWTALCLDFRLAESILRDDFIKAAKYMEQIGESGDFVNKHGYHDWPLMQDFRESEEFRIAYEKIYGHPFSNELKRTAVKATKESEKEVLQKKEELQSENSDILLAPPCEETFINKERE